MVKIFTFQFNDPDFLNWQHQCFKKFLTDEHELICINNAIDPHIAHQIELMAIKLGIKSHIVEGQDHSLHGVSHQRAMNWAWNKFAKNHDGIVIYCDHDMFLINEISFNEGMTTPFYGIPQSRAHIQYPHPGFIAMDMKRIPDKDQIDFYGGNIDGHNVDSGGQIYHYFKSHPEISITWLPLIDIVYENSNLHLLPEQARYGYDERYNFQIVSDFMFHFRIGSNWIHLSKQAQQRRKEQAKATIDYYLSL